eukprot:jgi/Tetstr1/439778/TSEL_028191.t1
MYFQGRMPGWFNRLFAFAKLVAPVKKLGEGGAPDVRHVSGGRGGGARRVAERAVVDNMKEAYVSVQQRESTLEVIDGAARFNADDGYFVVFPEHVWPALHAFRMPITASVGLKVRFDKMHAYIADMEAARREAPADIEWPELDGHHGIPVLNVPPHLRPKHCKPDALQRNFFRPRRYHHFLNDARGSASYTAAMRETWGRLQAATSGQLSDADALVTEREAEVASGSQKELTPFL